MPSRRALRSLAMTLLGVGLLAASAVRADSDGTFCVAEGYVAYELREGSAPEAHHALHFAFVARPDGAPDSASVSLPDFQVHGMRCEPQRVVILGFDQIHEIALPHGEPPRLASAAPYTSSRIPAVYRAESLSLARQSRVVPIPSPRPARRYELRIGVRVIDAASSPDGAIHYEITGTLAETDLEGRLLRERLLYTGEAMETVD
jgi:hypothetical protein